MCNINLFLPICFLHSGTIGTVYLIHVKSGIISVSRGGGEEGMGEGTLVK